MSPAQLAYREYLESEHWRLLRTAAFRHYGRKCSRCPATCRLQVHHTHYVFPWTSTPVTDLMILCRPCHEREHGIVKVVTVVEQVQIQRRSRKVRRSKFPKMSAWQRKAYAGMSRKQRKRFRKARQRLQGKMAKTSPVFGYSKPFSKRPRWVNRDRSSN